VLAPAHHVDWDAVGYEVENDIQALTADNDFTSSEILPELEADTHDSDEAESQAYLEECVGLLYDLESDEMHNPQ
jgi:hypothetical protein